MTPDELKSMPKGQFIVMKTGFYPMKVQLKLFFKWGIKFEEEYAIEEKGNRKVLYADKQEIIEGIMKRYPRGYAMEEAETRLPEDGGRMTVEEASLRVERRLRHPVLRKKQDTEKEEGNESL